MRSYGSLFYRKVNYTVKKHSENEPSPPSKNYRVKICDLVMEASPKRKEKPFTPEVKLYSREAH